MQLAIALRATATRLEAPIEARRYQWGHFGMCNCGHLVQTVCGLTPPQIHRIALEREGDWEQLANAYCPTSGYAIDDVIARLLELGLSTEDIGHLEKLSDPRVRARMAVAYPQHNVREDVVAYLRAWADLLDETAPLATRVAA